MLYSYRHCPKGKYSSYNFLSGSLQKLGEAFFSRLHWGRGPSAVAKSNLESCHLGKYPWGIAACENAFVK